MGCSLQYGSVVGDSMAWLDWWLVHLLYTAHRFFVACYWPDYVISCIVHFVWNKNKIYSINRVVHTYWAASSWDQLWMVLVLVMKLWVDFIPLFWHHVSNLSWLSVDAHSAALYCSRYHIALQYAAWSNNWTDLAWNDAGNLQQERNIDYINVISSDKVPGF